MRCRLPSQVSRSQRHAGNDIAPDGFSRACLSIRTYRNQLHACSPFAVNVMELRRMATPIGTIRLGLMQTSWHTRSNHPAPPVARAQARADAGLWRQDDDPKLAIAYLGSLVTHPLPP